MLPMSSQAGELLGVYGGTFDPPHRAHLAVMLAAASRFSLARVLMVPTGFQPLKTATPHAGFADRLAMCSLLCAEAAASAAGAVFEVSALEEGATPDAPAYTVDLLRRLLTDSAPPPRLHVIVGADAFLDLRRWREPDALLSIADWIVVSRPGFSLNDLSALALTPAQQGRVHLLDDVHANVSATAVRAALAQHDAPQQALTPAVATYICTHRLYET